MNDCTEETCGCPACVLVEHLQETIANGFPPDLIVPMVLDVLSTVVNEYGIDVIVIVREQSVNESGTVH